METRKGNDALRFAELFLGDYLGFVFAPGNPFRTDYRYVCQKSTQSPRELTIEFEIDLFGMSPSLGFGLQLG
jgi:hypothetical protein